MWGQCSGRAQVSGLAWKKPLWGCNLAQHMAPDTSWQGADFNNAYDLNGDGDNNDYEKTFMRYKA